MKKRVSVILLAGLLLVVSFVFAFDVGGIKDWIPSPQKMDGRLYQQALAEAIMTSSRIVIIEHSDRMDFPPDGAKRPDLPRYEYRRVELTASQQAAFLQDVLTMDPKTRTRITMCAFVPHHTVEFYSATNLTSSMQICFQCAKIQWDGSRRAVPQAIFRPITALIERVGLEKERDWRGLVSQASAAQTTSTP